VQEKGEAGGGRGVEGSQGSGFRVQENWMRRVSR